MTWTIINHEVGSNTFMKKEFEYLNKLNKLIKNPTEIANTLHSYYIKIRYIDISNKLPRQNE